MANFGQKSQSWLFCLKMDAQSIARILILIPTLIFSISNPKCIFEQIWAEKVKIIILWFYSMYTKTLSCSRATNICWMENNRDGNRAFSSSLLRGIITCNHLPFFKKFSNLVHFCANFQIFCPFLTFFCPFLENHTNALTF